MTLGEILFVRESKDINAALTNAAIKEAISIIYEMRNQTTGFISRSDNIVALLESFKIEIQGESK